MQHALRGILLRHKSLVIRPIDFDVTAHVRKRDPGCYGESQDFLRPYEPHVELALVMFGREGSGQGSRDAEEMEGVIPAVFHQARRERE